MEVPVIVGLAAGITFVFVIFLALNPPISRFITDVKPEEHVLMDKARQQEATQLFLKKYPFAQEGILNRDPIIEYDDNGNPVSSTPAVTVAYYPPWPRTIITYEDVNLNNLLVRYEYPGLWVVMDLDGNIENVILRCGISYLGSHGGMGGAVAGNDIVLKFLNVSRLPC